MEALKLKDPERWQHYVDVNKSDAYGSCCVDIARRVMELLDERPAPLKHGYAPDLTTPHGLICKADDDIKAGGSTGFMAGAAAAMVSECHERGEEFRKAWNNDDRPGTKNPALVTIAKATSNP